LSLHPKLIDLSLDRMWRILEVLGSPHKKLPPVIHVAGTNGKGSTIAFLRSIVEASGLKAHVYTSPHLVRFNERIRVAGELISEPDLLSLLDEVEAANNGEPITMFEITSAAAFLAFSRTPADVALIEVGLGGRFDATNVFDAPAMTVITPIGYDHMAWLGDTLDQIAGEKAGILKNGVPAIIAAQSPEARARLRQEVTERGAIGSFAGEAWTTEPSTTGLKIHHNGETIDLPTLGLLGPHQVTNAAAAVMAARALGHPAITPKSERTGVANARWPGRFHRVMAGPLADLVDKERAELWVDGAHNPQGAEALAAALGPANAGQRTVLVCAMFADKDAAPMLAALAPSIHVAVATSFPADRTRHSPEHLAETLTRLGVPTLCELDLETAIHEAAKRAGQNGRVIVAGSLFLVAEVLATGPRLV
jgi:dihydrofolate synthase / folylpolyglutamate synthase